MAKYWKEYWILFRYKNNSLQLINNWHEFKSEEWHLISLFKKYRDGRYEYYFALLGFQFRIINHTIHNTQQ